MDGKKLVSLMALTGVFIGLIAAYTAVEDQRECRAIEDEIKIEQEFDGSVACYPPGVMEVNVSEELEDRTDLQCVCRIAYNNQMQILPIVRS